MTWRCLSWPERTALLAALLAFVLFVMMAAILFSHAADGTYIVAAPPLLASVPLVVPFDTLDSQSSDMATPRVQIRVHQDWDWVDGMTSPNATVWMTLTDRFGAVKGTSSAGAGGDGRIPKSQFWHDDKPVDIVATDMVAVTSSDGSPTSARVITMSGTINAVADMVSGAVQAAVLPAHVRAEVQLGDGSQPVKDGMTDAGGNYLLSFSPFFDLRKEHQVVIWCYEPDGDAIGIVRTGFTIYVDYTQNLPRVHGSYEVGHQVWITLTESDQTTIKATTTVWSLSNPWGKGVDGFSVDPQDWTPANPAVELGDWVYATVDDGQTTDLGIGAITIYLDIDNDIVSGTITAPWFTETLRAQCAIHEEGGPSQEFSVDPNGGAYLCDFSLWDLRPHHRVGVSYWEPDGDQLSLSFRQPSPNLHVDAWPEGQEGVAPGGPMVVAVRYVNNGDGPGAAILTATLPVSVTYVADSSGHTASVSGSLVTWNLGTIMPGSQLARFYLVLANSATISTTLVIGFDIGTAFENDWNDNHAEAHVHVKAGQPDLFVMTMVNPNEPAPGQLFQYRIEYGNGGPVPGGPVCLTHTLPVSTSFSGWRSKSGYILWQEVITSNQMIILCSAAVPGWWKDQIDLTVRLDDAVPYGVLLGSTTVVSSTADSNPGNNISSCWAKTAPPRPDAFLGKYWAFGVLAPGGGMVYRTTVRNEGNALIHNATLTDTIPPGTTYVTSVLVLDQGMAPFAPHRVGGDQLAWDLGDLETNAKTTLLMLLGIESATPVGTLLSNCARLTVNELEQNPYNNTACVTETVRAAGPNLRATIYADRYGRDGVSYTVNAENIGTVAVPNVLVTTTYPLSATLGGWDVQWGRKWQGAAAGNQITLTFDRLNAAEVALVRVHVGLPPLPNGTFFTSTAEVTTSPDDLNPLDNRHVFVLGTGPNLSIEKWLLSSIPGPGQILTYTLHAHNEAHEWQTEGHVWITDVLPIGTEFLGSVQRLCGWTMFCPRYPDYNDGRVLAWDLGQGFGRWWNDLVVTVRVTTSVQEGATLTNTAFIASDDPIDVEPDYSNNTASVLITLPTSTPTPTRSPIPTRTATTTTTPVTMPPLYLPVILGAYF